MITKDNLKEVIQSIDEKAKKRILKSNKEFIVLSLHCFNVGCFVTVNLTNNYNRYKYVSNYGNCILYVEEVINILKEVK